MTRAAVAMLGLTGCTIGAGSSFMGQWGPHDVPRFDACLVDDAGQCRDHKQVVTHVPERSFSGVVATLGEGGGASVTQGGDTTTRVRLAANLEYLRGTSRWAVGVRTGVQTDTNAATAVPVVALGHLGLTDRIAIVAGGGYIPYAEQHGEQAAVGVQGAAGVQLALSRVRSQNYLALTVEADTTWIDFARSYRSTGMVGSIGLFF
jgi:hypothetical protein